MVDINKYDYIVVGAGLSGSVIAERISNVLDKKVLVIDKRTHIGGNCYSEIDHATGIEYHKYGPHIFHTDNKEVWDYLNRFTKFNNYHHNALTLYNDEIYQLPINLSTINKFFGKSFTPDEAKKFIDFQIKLSKIESPQNLEEQAISLIGKAMYEAFIKGYTLKQWQKDPKELSAEIIKRIPFRFNYDNTYFNNAIYEGIPLNGYTKMFEKMIDHSNIDVILNTDFFEFKTECDLSNKIIIYTGPIDHLFDYKFGKLEWRSLDFKYEIHDTNDYQGNSLINYANVNIPWTRIHEYKHFHKERENLYNKNTTLICKEYSVTDENNPYYPVNNVENAKLFQLYKEESEKNPNIIINGRLGEYEYYDMDKTVESALNLFKNKISKL